MTYQSAENKKCDMVIFDINCVDEVMDSETILCGYYGQGNILSLEKAPRLLFETPSACNKLYKRKVFMTNYLWTNSSSMKNIRVLSKSLV